MCSDARALLHLPGKMRQFGQQDRCLKGIEPPVGAEDGMMMALEPTVGADLFHLLGEIIIIREQCAAVSIAAERLRREETRAADGGDAATPTPVLRRTETLGGILDHGQVVPRGNLVDSAVIRHLAERTD